MKARSSPDTETLIENLLDACVAYERSEGFEGKYRRQDLDEAKQALRDALARPGVAQTPDLRAVLLKVRNWLDVQFNEPFKNDELAKHIGLINDALAQGPDTSTVLTSGEDK